MHFVVSNLFEYLIKIKTLYFRTTHSFFGVFLFNQLVSAFSILLCLVSTVQQLSTKTLTSERCSIFQLWKWTVVRVLNCWTSGAVKLWKFFNSLWIWYIFVSISCFNVYLRIFYQWTKAYNRLFVNHTTYVSQTVQRYALVCTLFYLWNAKCIFRRSLRCWVWCQLFIFEKTLDLVHSWVGSTRTN